MFLMFFVGSLFFVRSTQKLWLTSVVYLITVFGIGWFSLEEVTTLFLNGGVGLVAFCLVNETLATPMNRRGHYWFAFIAAGSSFLFYFGGFESVAVYLGVIFAHLWTPWLDLIAMSPQGGKK